MGKVYVMDNRGREKQATKVRYFKYNDNNYFVYTLNEIDEDGYIKLYIKKIVNGEDREIEDTVWDSVKAIIQEVFREIKAGTHYSYEDLNIDEVNEIMESGAKIFRLRKDVVDEIISLIPSNHDDDVDKFSSEIGNALANTLKEEVLDFKNRQEIRSKYLYEEEEKLVDNKDIEEKINNIDEKLIDEIIEEPKEINEDKYIEKPKKVEDKYEEKVNQTRSSRLKPIVIGSMPTIEYKEKIEALEKDNSVLKENISSLEHELRNYQETCFSLKKQNDTLKKDLEKYEARFNNLKSIIKDI